MRFLDSNIFAYAFYENEHQEKCQQAIREGGITNTIVLVEAFNIIEWQTGRENATKVIRGLLKSNIHIVDGNMNLIFETLKRAEKYKRLKFMDLLHYTTALTQACESILSYDSDFNNLEIKREEP